MRKIRIAFVFTIIVILLVMNSMFYFVTRNTLEENQEQMVDLVINNITDAIDTTRTAENHFDKSLSNELRKSSLAIKYALPKNINDVTNEQLRGLSNQLGLEGISLLVPKNEEFRIEKSSHKEELGLETGEWGQWNQMFRQLQTKENVIPIPGFGEKGENFWSGPIYPSNRDAGLLTKWGYYYDGSTNYIIAPFIDEKLITDFFKRVGVDNSIKEKIEADNTILEIGVFNMDVVKKLSPEMLNLSNTMPTILGETGVPGNRDQILRYGFQKYHHKRDYEFIEEAISSNEAVQKKLIIEKKRIMRHYIPFHSNENDSYKKDFVIVITTDYEQLMEKVHDKVKAIFMISLLMFITGFFFIYHMVRIINKKERTIYNIHEMYEKNNNTFFKSLKEYRHDMKHHLHTISGLVKMEMFDDLSDYIERLDQEAKIDEISDINMPVMIGLIHSKIAQSQARLIQFDYHFEGFEQIDLDMEKASDLVRIVGNILDNAFNAVTDRGMTDGKVIINGKHRNGVITFTIYNNGEPLPESDFEKIFTYGYSTRLNRGGNGLGLSSSKAIIQRYKGDINVSTEGDFTRFEVSLPVSSKEFRDVKYRSEV